MVEVQLWSGLKRFTDGKQIVEVEGRTIGEVLNNLVKAYPALEPTIEAGVSVAVNGKIMARDLTTEIEPESEVFLLQQLKGG
ncbi:MAG: MoaD/ThiS family protein [Pseudomonadota bacterium]